MSNILEEKNLEIENESVYTNKTKNNETNFNLIKVFNWGWFKFAKCTFGIFIFSLAINLFIVPNNLYTGGTLGIAQLIRNAIIFFFKIDVKFDISSIIYYLINVPLFLIAFKRISKTFFIRTLFAVSINSLFLMIVPIPKTPLIKDLLGNVLIGGFLGGIGAGMALSTGSSTGGTDIIGVALSQKNKKYSVGSIGLIFNVIVYSICGLCYGIETMIYSIIFAVFETITIDRNHTQNILSKTLIFTKKDPQNLIKFINYDLKRDATYWNATGGYTNENTYIILAVLSKYERMRLERHINEFDENAFMVGNDGVEIRGNFSKYLI